MKKQHPTNPNLFWCPKCKTFKEKGLFKVYNSRPHKISSYCRLCGNARQQEWNRNKYKTDPAYAKHKSAYHAEWQRNKCKTDPAYVKHKNACNVEWMRNKRKTDPAYAKRQNALIAKRKKHYTSKLKDYYLKQNLKKTGLPITPEMLELKRVQISMKRTLKEIKKWRKDNEPNYTDV